LYGQRCNRDKVRALSKVSIEPQEVAKIRESGYSGEMKIPPGKSKPGQDRFLAFFTSVLLSLAFTPSCKRASSTPDADTKQSAALAGVDALPLPNCPLTFDDNECSICRDLETTSEGTPVAGEDAGKAMWNPCGIDEPTDRLAKVPSGKSLTPACLAHRDCLKEAVDHGARGVCNQQFLVAIRNLCEGAGPYRQNCVRDAFQALGVCHAIGGLTRRIAPAN
jgi:hypothetical protein